MTDLIEGTLEKARAAIATHDLVAPDAAVLLMVSGGSDSTALAYLGAALREAGDVGPVAMLHVNHQLRGEDADADERFVAALAEALDIPLFICSIDIAAEAERSRENVEAVARRERYLAANEALRSMCQHEGRPLSEARIFPAIDLAKSGTRHEELLLSPEECEGVAMVRRMLGQGHTREATAQLISMLLKTEKNEDFFKRLKEWLAIWEKEGYTIRSLRSGV